MKSARGVGEHSLQARPAVNLTRSWRDRETLTMLFYGKLSWVLWHLNGMLKFQNWARAFQAHYRSQQSTPGLKNMVVVWHLHIAFLWHASAFKVCLHSIVFHVLWHPNHSLVRWHPNGIIRFPKWARAIQVHYRSQRSTPDPWEGPPQSTWGSIDLWGNRCSATVVDRTITQY